MNKHLVLKLKVNQGLVLKLKVNTGKRLVLIKAAANRGQKRQPNSVSVSVTQKCDANGSENPIANALFFALMITSLIMQFFPNRLPTRSTGRIPC